MKDKIESKRVGKLVRAKNKQCYYNASQVLMHIPEYADADYVEGMAVLDGLTIEHGWVEKDGVIIDPTQPDLDGKYFPGLRFRGVSGLADALRTPKPHRSWQDFPIFYRFGWGGIDSPEFRAALVAAYRYAGLEGLAKQYEEYKPLYDTKVLANGETAVVLK